MREELDHARRVLRDSRYDALRWARDNPADAAVFAFVVGLAGFLIGRFV
jgi:predicted helicase